MAAADVEALSRRALRLFRADRMQIVQPAEEERRVGEVGERFDALLDLRLQDGGVDPVRGDIADVECLDVLAHRAQRGTRIGEMGAFAPERVGGAGVGGFRDVRGHGLPPAATAWIRITAWIPARVTAGITAWRTGRFPSGRRRSPGEAGKTGDCSQSADRGRMVFHGEGAAAVLPVGDDVCLESYASGLTVQSVVRCEERARKPSWRHEYCNLYPRPRPPPRSRRHGHRRRTPLPAPCRQRAPRGQGLRRRRLQRRRPR